MRTRETRTDRLHALPTIVPGPVSWPTVFGRTAPLELEIGFGRPNFLLERATQAPDSNVVGIEIKARWAAVARKRAARMGLRNVNAIAGNAWHLVGGLFADGALSKIFLNFPDPWWKAKHRKRRVIHPAFARLLVDKLEVGGQLLIQTDVASLLEAMLEVLQADPRLENPNGPGRLCPRKPVSARTHRERKCLEQGIAVFRAALVRRV